MDARTISVSIIMTTRNRAAHLKATLESLAKVEIPDSLTCELIIVDNGSSDDTAMVIQENILPNLVTTVLQERRIGQAFARNSGLNAAAGEIIVFTDDDVRFPEYWISRLCRPIFAGEADAVAGGIHIAPELERPWMHPMHRALLAETKRLESEDTLHEMVGANMAFLRDALVDVPQFDTELGPGALGFADDSLFALQLCQSGRKIAPAFDVSVEHHFDKRRLNRTDFLSAIRRSAASWAYITHHWEHDSRNLSVLPLFKRPLRLHYERLRHPGYKTAEGIPEWELRILWDFYYLQRRVILKNKPQNYDWHGQVKREARRNGTVFIPSRLS
jgi:glycosyltransferase involved in cell wall biosynthesis